MNIWMRIECVHRNPAFYISPFKFDCLCLKHFLIHFHKNLVFTVVCFASHRNRAWIRMKPNHTSPHCHLHQWFPTTPHILLIPHHLTITIHRNHVNSSPPISPLHDTFHSKVPHLPLPHHPDPHVCWLWVHPKWHRTKWTKKHVLNVFPLWTG